MRTNKQSEAQLRKAASIQLRGRNEFSYIERHGLRDMATTPNGHIDMYYLIEVAYNLGYLRGMKHEEHTTFKAEALMPEEYIAPEEAAPNQADKYSSLDDDTKAKLGVLLTEVQQLLGYTKESADNEI